MRDYRFLIAFEEAGIWKELALASDGSLPRVDRSRDQHAGWLNREHPEAKLLVFAPKWTRQTSRPTFTTINHISFVNMNFDSGITK